MPTVNFQCGHCNNLMAVSAEYLGQQVRCPHCQSVVVAPAAAPAPAPARAAEPTLSETVSFQAPQLNEQDDIFAPPEPVDDLFGRPDAPRVELPPPEPAPAPRMEEPTLDNAAQQPAPEPFAPTMTWPGSQPAVPAPAGDATLPSWMDHPAGPASSASSPTQTAATDGERHEAIPQLVRKPRDSGGWFIGLVFIPLISYSVLATVAVIVLWYRLQQQPPPPPNPLETLPSFDPSDEQHTTRVLLGDKVAHLPVNNKAQMAIPRNIDVKIATMPLPDNLLVRLGDKRKLRIGDLEVEPLGVNLEQVSVAVQGFNAEPCKYPSLKLRLKLRNVSDNVTFQPMDTYFDRRWKGKGEAPPLTILELVAPNHPPTRFFGGPAEFHPPLLHANSGGDPPQWIEGAHRDQVLAPGEEMETFVCTDGDNRDATEAVGNHHGKFLWRIHVRRGIVKLDEHRYAPVSSVIGVEFTDDDFGKSS